MGFVSMLMVMQAAVPLAAFVVVTLALSTVVVALVFVDAKTHTLPNALTLPGLALSIVGLLLWPDTADAVRWLDRCVEHGPMLLFASECEQVPYESLLTLSADQGEAMAAAGVLIAIFLVLHLIHPRGIGFGDVKFSAVLAFSAAWFGWQAVAWAGLLGFVFAGIAGAYVLARRPPPSSTTPIASHPPVDRVARSAYRDQGTPRRLRTLPMGPWMAIGWAVAIVATVVGGAIA